MSTHLNGFGIMTIGKNCLRVKRDGTVIIAEPGYVRKQRRLEIEILGGSHIPLINGHPQPNPQPNPHKPGEAARS